MLVWSKIYTCFWSIFNNHVLPYFSQVLKRRKRFEYKLQKQNKEKADFLAYIQYEMGILSLIELRREVSQLSNTSEFNTCIDFYFTYFIFSVVTVPPTIYIKVFQLATLHHSAKCFHILIVGQRIAFPHDDMTNVIPGLRFPVLEICFFQLPNLFLKESCYVTSGVFVVSLLIKWQCKLLVFVGSLRSLHSIYSCTASYSSSQSYPLKSNYGIIRMTLNNSFN